jgi:uncharacterized protein DUF2877
MLPPPLQPLPGEVSTAVLGLLTGPARPARVLGAGRHAAYLRVEPGSTVLALVTRDAVRVPNAVIVGSAAGGLLLAGLRPGTVAVVGEHRLVVGPSVVAVSSTWSPGWPEPVHPDHLPARVRHLAQLLARAAPPLPDYLEGPVSDFERALRGGDGRAAAGAAHRLLGLGPGMTPSGDDIVAGALVGVHALGEACPDPLAVAGEAIAAVVTDRAGERTTLVSASLLGHAAAGRCIPQVAALVTALGRPGPDLERPLRDLLAVGHHSGCDLARGVLTALAAADALRSVSQRWEIDGGPAVDQCACR